MKHHIETDLIHAGNEFNDTRAVVPPIFQTSTYYAPDDPEAYTKEATTANASYFYHRHGNPVNNQAAAVIAGLEGTEAAMLTATGMAAISTAVLTTVKSGDHVIVQESHYSAANILFRDLLPDLGIQVSRADQTENSSFEEAIRPNTKLIYLETPSNPNLAVTDLEYVGKLARKNKITTICDNTFASPVNLRPGDWGIDVVVHSATKYLGGHSDLTAGAICGSRDFISKAWKKGIILGGALAPFDAWLLLRGLRTLTLRVNQINENALQLATWLEKHPAVKQVLYCGLPSHPQHLLASKLMTGFTGMLCVELAAASEEEGFERAQYVLQKLTLFANAASLGGVESLAVHPASMWGLHHSKEQKKKAGINDAMLRISVGIEHAADLIADFDQALAE